VPEGARAALLSQDSLSTAASTPMAAGADQPAQPGVLRTLSDINPLYGRVRMDSDQSADLPLEYDGEPASLPMAPLPLDTHSSLVGGLSLTSEEMLPPVEVPEVRTPASLPARLRCAAVAADGPAGPPARQVPMHAPAPRMRLIAAAHAPPPPPPPLTPAAGAHRILRPHRGGDGAAAAPVPGRRLARAPLPQRRRLPLVRRRAAARVWPCQRAPAAHLHALLRSPAASPAAPLLRAPQLPAPGAATLPAASALCLPAQQPSPVIPTPPVAAPPRPGRRCASWPLPGRPPAARAPPSQRRSWTRARAGTRRRKAARACPAATAAAPTATASRRPRLRGTAARQSCCGSARCARMGLACLACWPWLSPGPLAWHWRWAHRRSRPPQVGATPRSEPLTAPLPGTVAVGAAYEPERWWNNLVCAARRTWHCTLRCAAPVALHLWRCTRRRCTRRCCTWRRCTRRCCTRRCCTWRRCAAPRRLPSALPHPSPAPAPTRPAQLRVDRLVVVHRPPRPHPGPLHRRAHPRVAPQGLPGGRPAALLLHARELKARRARLQAPGRVCRQALMMARVGGPVGGAGGGCARARAPRRP
jgi:hypothetical protein